MRGAKYITMTKGVKNASIYWGHSSYVISGLAEEYLHAELPCGM
jgi:hypothetical protein